MGESYENGVTPENGPTCGLHAQLCPSSSGPPWTVAPPGSSIHGILQAGILEWVAISSSRGSSQPRDRTPASPASAGELFTPEPTGTPQVALTLPLNTFFS